MDIRLNAQAAEVHQERAVHVAGHIWDGGFRPGVGPIRPRFHGPTVELGGEVEFRGGVSIRAAHSQGSQGAPPIPVLDVQAGPVRSRPCHLRGLRSVQHPFAALHIQHSLQPIDLVQVAVAKGVSQAPGTRHRALPVRLDEGRLLPGAGDVHFQSVDVAVAPVIDAVRAQLKGQGHRVAAEGEAGLRGAPGPPVGAAEVDLGQQGLAIPIRVDAAAGTHRLLAVAPAFEQVVAQQFQPDFPGSALGGLSGALPPRFGQGCQERVTPRCGVHGAGKGSPHEVAFQCALHAPAISLAEQRPPLHGQRRARGHLAAKASLGNPTRIQHIDLARPWRACVSAEGGIEPKADMAIQFQLRGQRQRHGPSFQSGGALQSFLCRTEVHGPLSLGSLQGRGLALRVDIPHSADRKNVEVIGPLELEHSRGLQVGGVSQRLWHRVSRQDRIDFDGACRRGPCRRAPQRCVTRKGHGGFEGHLPGDRFPLPMGQTVQWKVNGPLEVCEEVPLRKGREVCWTMRHVEGEGRQLELAAFDHAIGSGVSPRAFHTRLHAPSPCRLPRRPFSRDAVRPPRKQGRPCLGNMLLD